MARVGPVVTIPTGSYCRIRLGLGQRIVVKHALGGRGGAPGARLTVDRVRLLGFRSERVAQIDLETSERQSALVALTRANRVVPRLPLQVFVAYIQGCASVADVATRCRELLEPPVPAAARRSGHRVGPRR